MKRIITLLLLAGTTVYTTAQQLPKASPEAKVEQFIGATTLELNYSRPGVKEREIFGGLIPFETQWRFGANSATTLTTDHSLFFDGKELKAGTYSVFATPGKESWEISFNLDTKATTDTYNKEQTVLTTKGKVSENSFTESLYIGFDEIKEDAASIVILWEKTKVEIPFTINTKENSVANIKKAIEKGEDLSAVYSNAANYFYSSLKDNKGALNYVNKSIKLESNYRNLFLKARIINELGEKKEAIELAEKALELAKKDASAGFQNYISGTIEKWTK